MLSGRTTKHAKNVFTLAKERIPLIDALLKHCGQDFLWKYKRLKEI
jgi:hypothetical protein